MFESLQKLPTDRYSIYLSDIEKIVNTPAGVHYVTSAKPHSDKLLQVYLELCKLCAPHGYMAFLRPKLECVAGSQSKLRGVRDAASWRAAVLELAVCESDGTLMLVVVKGRTKVSLKDDLLRLQIPFRELSGLQPPPQEAEGLLAAAQIRETTFSGAMSPKQLITARYLSRFLSVGVSADLLDVKEVKSAGLAPQEIDLVGHYTRSRHWFLAHEVALSSLVEPNIALLSPQSVQFIQDSSVDAVVYSSRPFAKPVLAIEFDGTQHAEYSAVARDRLKTGMLDSVGIPLLRISTMDGDFVSWFSASNAQKQRINIYFTAVGLLVRRLVAQVVSDRRKQHESAAEHIRLKNALDQIADINFGKSFAELTPGEVRQVFESEDYEDWFEKELVDQGMPVDESEVQPTAYELLKVELVRLGISTERLQTYSLKHAGDVMRPVAKIILLNGRSRFVEGPSVAIRLSATSQDFVDDAILTAFKLVMAEQIRAAIDLQSAS